MTSLAEAAKHCQAIIATEFRLVMSSQHICKSGYQYITISVDWKYAVRSVLFLSGFIYGNAATGLKYHNLLKILMYVLL